MNTKGVEICHKPDNVGSIAVFCKGEASSREEREREQEQELAHDNTRPESRVPKELVHKVLNDIR